MVAFLLANMIYTDALVSLFAFGGIYAAGTFGWNTIQIGTFGIILAIAGTFGAWLGGKLDDKLGPKRVIAGSMMMLLFAIVAILLVDKDSILFIKVTPPAARWCAVRRKRRARLSPARMPDRGRRRSAAGGIANALDTTGAERAYRAIFRTVRADRQGHVLRRAAPDRRDHGGHRKPEGRAWRCWCCSSSRDWRYWHG